MLLQQRIELFSHKVVHERLLRANGALDPNLRLFADSAPRLIFCQVGVASDACAQGCTRVGVYVSAQAVTARFAHRKTTDSYGSVEDVLCVYSEYMLSILKELNAV